MRAIDGDMLMEYCLNQKDKTVDCNDIARFPTLDVTPVVHGGWINYKDSHQCDKCGEFVFMDPHSWEDDELAYDFCPNCGADMRGAQQCR